MTRTLPLRSALVVLLASLAVAPAASARPDTAARLQMVWPASGTVTARFGEWRGSHRHAGIDIGMLRTLRLRSVLAGTVKQTGYVSGYEGYGNVVILDLPGPYTALYAHLSSRSRPSGSARSQRTASRPRRLHGQLLRHAPPFRDRTARRAGGSPPLPRLRRLSWPPMRSRYLVDGASVVAVALFLGWVLSLATTRVKNWFVMTDELYYERLAVSVAQTGSLLPRLHGELVPNVNQLYPILISPLYGDGNVPASFEGAHRLNAFLIASAAIPVYLLARRIGLGRLVALWAGALSVAVPWVALASFLLTEVVAYPAFCWALLALTHAVARKSWRTDLLALVVIGVAVLARTQFVVLLAVFVVAVSSRRCLTRRRAAPRGTSGARGGPSCSSSAACCSSSSGRSRSARARSCSAPTRSPPSTCGSTSGSCGSRSSTWRCSRSGSRSCPSSSAPAGSSTASARRRPGRSARSPSSAPARCCSSRSRSPRSTSASGPGW